MNSEHSYFYYSLVKLSHLSDLLHHLGVESKLRLARGRVTVQIFALIVSGALTTTTTTATKSRDCSCQTPFLLGVVVSN